MFVHRQLAGSLAICLFVVACSSSATNTPPASATAAPPSVAVLASTDASGVPSASPTAAATATPSPTPTPTPVPEPTPTPVPEPTPTPVPEPTPAPTPTPALTPVAMALDAHVWWGGYAIDIGSATYDPQKRRLVITATFLNTSTSANDVSALAGELNVVWNGTNLQGFMPNGAVAAGGTVTGEIQFGPPAGFTPEAAVLTFGQPSEHQATVPLNGDAATSGQPITFPVSGTVKMGRHVRFAVKSGILIPASCAGSPTQMKYGAMKAGEMSIVLGGVATNSESGASAFIDRAFLTVPDSTTSAANPAMYLAVTSKGTVRDAAMCFRVPAPGSGAYKLTMHELRSKKNGAISFQVP